MNTMNSGDKILVNWMWIIIGSAALFVFVIVMWATSGSEGPPAKIDANQSTQSVNSGSGPTTGYRTPSKPLSGSVPNDMPPMTNPMPPLTSKPPAVVKITPQPKVPLQAPKKNESAIRGMFPMGHILASSSYKPRPQKPAKEVFGSFSYGGRLWQFTGKYAYTGQIDITPTGFEFDRRKIYAFANTAAPDKVLFVQSMVDPNRFAIYR